MDHFPDKTKVTVFLIVCLLWVGILARGQHLLENRSLWLDEAYLALNITESSYPQLLHHQPIIQEQAKAPLLFSLIVKSLTQVMGSAEWVLRLFPFMAGVGALVLFLFLARRIVDNYTALLALGLMTFCDRLVYYAAELKPYASDVFVTVGLYCLYDRIRRAPDERGRYIMLAVAGLAAIWLSYPGIIVLAAIGAVVFLQAPRDEKPFFFLIACLWLLNVGMVYKFAVSPMLASSYITGSIAEHFPPAPVWTAAGWSWWGRSWLRMFAVPLGQPVPLAGTLLLTVGVFSLWRRDRSWCAVLGVPLVLTMTAAAAGKYPFFGRHLLFLTPALFIFIALGTGVVARASRKAAWPVAIILVGVLIIKPIEDVIRASTDGREHENNRSVMQLVTAGYQPGDGLYMNTSAQYMFAYYLDRSGRESDFLEPLSVGKTEGLQGVLIGKIADDKPEFSYEYLVYDRHGNLTGKSFLGRPDLGVIREWAAAGKLQENQRGRNWLILSHIREKNKNAVYHSLRGQVEYGQKIRRRGAEATQFRWKD